MRRPEDPNQFEFGALVVIGCIIGVALIFVIKAAAKVFT